ncbi:MAG: dihydropteroate synthase [Jatrophihabitantaceae bacterium]
MLKLGHREFGPGEFAIMAIVNRTPDSFYDQGATFAFRAALDRVDEVVGQGADIVDIGGVKAAPGQEVTPAEEIERTVEFVATVRATHPEVIISVDTWRHEVGDAVCRAGADLLNDAWGGHDPLLAEVAAEHGVGIVCTHAGGLAPRTRPHRVQYDDVMADVLAVTVGLAERAVQLGVDPASVLIDPAHDFGKNTYHSLEVTRRLPEMIETGWPVLVSLSNKDFVGETLDRSVGDRLIGTLATTAICAWMGAVVYRVHNVVETRQTLDMVATIAGRRRPARTVRGLA